MILELDDRQFEVDVETTRLYSEQEAAGHCDCGYCRNYYACVDETFPGLRPFLGQFGLNIEAPEQLMPFEPTELLVVYAVSGKITRAGERPLSVDAVTVTSESAWEAGINTECPQPYFTLSVGPVEVPWVLEEPMEGIRSPANLPSFLQRMRRFILRKS